MALGFARRRVVVTGLGAVSPLGGSMADTWTRLLQNQSGATTLTEAIRQQHYRGADGGQESFDETSVERDLRWAQHVSCQVAAPVRNVPSDNKTPRFVQFALAASREALQHSQLLDRLIDTQDCDEVDSLRSRMGVSIGSGMSSVRQVVAASQLPSLRRISPHFVPHVLQNSASARVSIAFHLRGPNVSASTACAAGSHAIGDAGMYIQAGLADVMLAGGTEAAIEPVGVAGFAKLRALSTNYNELPHQASRPFDAERDGFVMAEGAAVLVLEELQHARRRNAPILAELTGYGASGDGHHITSPDPRGLGAQQAMRLALRTASDKEGHPLVDPRVDYVNAHATSTPVGDDIEARVLSELFGDDPPYVSSTKGATGHLLGAAGALEAALTVQTLVDQTMPPTLNLTETRDDYTARLRHVYQVTQHEELRVAMSNSFGFGGTNASLLFQKWD